MVAVASAIASPFFVLQPRVERVSPLLSSRERQQKKRSYTIPILAWVMADCAISR
jgi:hypothetical protein